MRGFRRLLRRIRGVLGSVGDDPVGSDPGPDDAQERHECGTRSEPELLLEEGMRPEVYLHSRVENAGGRLRQKRLVTESRLPESTVSRLLTRLESENHVVRRRVGRENVVCLPGNGPPEFDPTPSPATPETEPTAGEHGG